MDNRRFWCKLGSFTVLMLDFILMRRLYDMGACALMLSGCVAAAVVVAAEMRDISDMREAAEAVDDEGDNPSVTFGDSSLYTREPRGYDGSRSCAGEPRGYDGSRSCAGEPRGYDGSRSCTGEPRGYDGEHESCEGCRHDLGGGQCRINLESECGKGEHEAWEGKE